MPKVTVPKGGGVGKPISGNNPTPENQGAGDNVKTLKTPKTPGHYPG